MKVSIVTVVFNNPQIADALDSILSQRFEGELDLVVIDGGSTDGTLDVLRRFQPHLSVLVSEPDGGIYDAMNKGLSRATGDVIGTLNADDFYYHPGVLQRVLETFEDPSVQVSYGDLIMVDAQNTAEIKRYWQSEIYRPGLFERGWMPPHPTVFVRKAVYDAFGTFNTSYRIGADFDLLARFLGRERLKSVYIPEVLVSMRAGGASNGRLSSILKANLECYRACRSNGLKPSPLFIPIKLAAKIIQHFHSGKVG